MQELVSTWRQLLYHRQVLVIMRQPGLGDADDVTCMLSDVVGDAR